MTDSYLYFEVLDGKALELVKEHVAEETRTRIANSKLCEEYDAVWYYSSITDGTVTAIDLPKPHPEFTKGNRSSPKRKTAALERFQQQVGYDVLCRKIASELGICRTIHYQGNETINGYTTPGHTFRSANVLYLSEDGPYCICFVDPRPAIRSLEEKGYTVVTKFTPELPGCRLILKEEWELAVAERQLAEARQACAA